MTNILILPEESDSYRALSGDKESTGRTPGQALDALRAQLREEEAGTLVIVQSYKPDQFFDAAQQERLAELMRLRDAGELTAEDEGELESLIEAELRGAQARAEDMPHAMGRVKVPLAALTAQEVLEIAQELIQKYMAVASDEEIAVQLGVNSATSRRWLIRFQATLRAATIRKIDR